MTKLGLWKLMTHHQPHRHTLRRHQEMAYDEAEICKPRRKYERPQDDNGSDRTQLTAPEECVDQLTSADAEAATTSKKQKHVSFATVEVRTYELVLGDNRDVSFPLALGWKYNIQQAQDLDTYESTHQPKRIQQRIEDSVHIGDLLGLDHTPVDRLMLTTMRPLTLHERRMLLRAQGHSEQALRQAERKRRVELALQWASGHYPKQEAFPYSERFFLNYVL